MKRVTEKFASTIETNYIDSLIDGKVSHSIWIQEFEYLRKADAYQIVRLIMT